MKMLFSTARYIIMFQKIDRALIGCCKKSSGLLARFSLFVVFFWFGALKLLAVSPASAMVAQLQQQTLPFISFPTFITLFGLYEMVIGLFFLFPRLTRVTLALLMPHLIATVLPLFLLPALTWENFLVPTMEGQYIIKNLAIIALAFSLGARLEPTPPPLNLPHEHS